MRTIPVYKLETMLGCVFETGILIWLKTGKRAGYTKDGRRYIQVDGEEYQCATIVWTLCYKQWPKGVIDHKDRDKSNDAISNLRDATRSQNCMNTKMYSNNTSGYRGVARAPGGKFKAYIRVNKRIKHLGVFDSPQEASYAYRKAAKEIYKEFEEE